MGGANVTVFAGLGSCEGAGAGAGVVVMLGVIAT